MTRTSATYRSSSQPRLSETTVKFGSAARRNRLGRSGEDGFTLIEVIIVLVILGLLAGLVLPNMPGLFESATRATERDRILDQFAALGAEAVRQGRDFAVLGTGADFDPATYMDFEPYPFVVPEGWEVLVEEPILVRANGVCLGGTVTLRHAEAPPTELELIPPLCRVDADA